MKRGGTPRRKRKRCEAAAEMETEAEHPDLSLVAARPLWPADYVPTEADMTQFASGEAKPASPEANRAHERTAGQPPQNAYSAPEGGSWARWGYWTA